MNIADKAKDYGRKRHWDTNHYYDEDHPYYMHLTMVVSVAMRFAKLVPDNEWENVLAGCWVHDVIEDCRQSYNDVKEATSERVAELAYALTNEKGKNRKERGSDKYYADMKKVPNAAFIKLCDRIANVEYSKMHGSSMLGMYKKENPKFVDHLYDEDLKPMFEYLEELIYTKQK